MLYQSNFNEREHHICIKLPNESPQSKSLFHVAFQKILTGILRCLIKLHEKDMQSTFHYLKGFTKSSFFAISHMNCLYESLNIISYLFRENFDCNEMDFVCCHITNQWAAGTGSSPLISQLLSSSILPLLYFAHMLGNNGNANLCDL